MKNPTVPEVLTHVYKFRVFGNLIVKGIDYNEDGLLEVFLIDKTDKSKTTKVLYKEEFVKWVEMANRAAKKEKERALKKAGYSKPVCASQTKYTYYINKDGIIIQLAPSEKLDIPEDWKRCYNKKIIKRWANQQAQAEAPSNMTHISPVNPWGITRRRKRRTNGLFRLNRNNRRKTAGRLFKFIIIGQQGQRELIGEREVKSSDGKKVTIHKKYRTPNANPRDIRIKVGIKKRVD